MPTCGNLDTRNWCCWFYPSSMSQHAITTTMFIALRVAPDVTINLWHHNKMSSTITAWQNFLIYWNIICSLVVFPILRFLQWNLFLCHIFPTCCRAHEFSMSGTIMPLGCGILLCVCVCVCELSHIYALLDTNSFYFLAIKLDLEGSYYAILI